MAKNSFRVSALKQGGKALIRITGTIEESSSALFQSQIDSLIEDGINDVHLYINSEGGSCFAAAEIVNIIQSNFSGRITGEGGALVASASTFIALHCSTFVMPENGMFMIHKPSGTKEGNARDLESFTKLLRDIENQYYNVYKNRVVDVSILDEQWNAGDWWMTAQEAKENGFITEVKEQITIDSKTAALISACGCPRSKFPQGKSNQKANENTGDELTQIAEALDLPTDATLKQILEAIAVLKGEETPEKAVETAIKVGAIEAYEKSEFLIIAKNNPKTLIGLIRKRKEQTKSQLNAKIDKTLNTAILEKRFVATAKGAWKVLFDLDFDAANAVLQHIEPLQKIDFKQPHTSGGNRAGWTLDDYRKKDPKALLKDPELYDRLLEKEQIK
ncbi:Clp protease ClpP [Dysgonomonas termitidis]|uniref:ATP-dependent Clp protease proteolytic subunit n=1 Tax=Dysgonomonas termitidis TaxID=1516126 RepID=A0ABV9L582_9BACT